MRKISSVLLILFMVLALAACSGSETTTWQEQYDLGMQYLTEGDYEQAVLAFTAAIEIDPKEAPAYVGRGNAYVWSGETEENLSQALADYETVLSLVEETLSTQGELTEENRDTLAQAYLGIADVYIRQGDYDYALEILEEGLEKTDGNEEIAAKIEEIKAGTITDSAGNVRRQVAYDGDGVQQWYHEFTYNADGTQASVTSYDSAGGQTGYVEFAYDEDGNIIVSYNYVANSGIVCRTEYEYDESGYCTLMISYAEDGSLLASHYYQRDSQGNIITDEQYDSGGKLGFTYYYDYDDEGNKIKRTIIRANGDLFSYETYEYDSEGHQIRTNRYDSDGELTEVRVNVYDDDGNYKGYEEYDGEGNLTASVLNE